MYLEKRTSEISSSAKVRHSLRSFACTSLVTMLLAGCGTIKMSSTFAASATDDSAAPTITAQPVNASVVAGQPASFSVIATGSGTLTYQWQRNAANISGATAATYSTPSTTSADDKSSFAVTISNASGTTTSAAATLSVSTPAPAPEPAATVASYYVAVNGDDRADGTSGNPFATLQRAQLAMQQSSIKVTQLNGGTYYLSSPLNLTAADQGETWQAVAGAKAILSGGQALTGWTSEGNGIYSAAAAQPVGLDLSIDGVRQQPAALGYDPQRPFITGWRILNTMQAESFGTTFTVQAGDLTASVRPGAIIQVIDFLRYTDNFTTIVSVDAAHNAITVANPFNVGTTVTGVSGSWRILNDPADLGAEGEFAYDATSAKVYVEPSSPDSLNTDTIVAARLSTLVTLSNVSGITITGITFADTTSDKGIYSGAFDDKLATIMATGLSNSAFSDNAFVNVGNAISLVGSSSNGITGNQFDQLGGSGIFITANSNHNNVTGNTMTGLGKINVGSTGIHLENSAHNLINNNTIDGSGRWAVDLYPTDGTSLVGNTISDNILRNTNQQTNDSAPIYSYAGNSKSYVDEDTTISGNRIENTGGLLRDASGGYKQGVTHGIYMDDQVSGASMNNNVIESDNNGIFLCHGCKGNTASNNVVVLQSAAIYDRGAKNVSYSTGSMSYGGMTRVDLLPSYFPSNISMTTVVVHLAGQASGSLKATFNVQADGVIIGTATASAVATDYMFAAQLTPMQSHRIAIALTNGATSGASTSALNNMVLFVNNTAVNLVAPEAQNNYGAYGFVVGNDNLQVTNFSATHNLVYRGAGLSQNLMDWTDWTNASYVDPNPGIVDDSVLYQSVAKANDTVLGSQVADSHSILADPLFTNAPAGDYTLQPNSPAFATGFTTAGVPLAQ